MGYIFYLMGKSSSGKDTIYKKILEKLGDKLKTVTGYTTRPMRKGEQDGVEYFFVTAGKYQEMTAAGTVIEGRDYNTVHGVWSYFTADDGQIELNKNNYLLIGTLESYEKIRKYYGEDKLIPVYINVEDGERLSRALNREKKQENPKYEEMCRRFLADQKDFSDENLSKCGIIKKYENDELEQCLNEILCDIGRLMEDNCGKMH